MFSKIVRKIKNLIFNLKQSIIQTFLYIFTKVEKNKIVFDNFSGKGYGCNPKYIAEELLKQDLNYDMVWLVRKNDKEIPEKIRQVKYGSLQAFKELATAKVWIDNVRDWKGVKKKKEQFYIQTWHAAMGLKKAEKDIEAFLDKGYIKDAKRDGIITDLMITNNRFMTELFRKSFWYNGEILEIGVPRNDIIIDTPEYIKEKVYTFFKIEKNKKIVIYAPTYRKNTGLDVYKFDYKKCLSKLEEKYNSKFVMLIRLHPNISNYADFISYDEHVINATEYSDIQELLAVSEIGITDYSSIMFDLSIVQKPVFLYGKDIDEFKKNERGLDFEIEELPFSFAKTEESFLENIKNFSLKDYEEKCKKFYDDIGLINNPNSSKEIVKIIKNKIEETN